VSLNKIFLIGRLTREPELRFTATGTPVANFTIAVDRNRPNNQGEKETDFLRIVVWGKQAENCSNYLGKGRLVMVEGRLQIGKYQDREGQTRLSPEVVAEFVQFLDRSENSGGGRGGGGRGNGSGQSSQAAAARPGDDDPDSGDFGGPGDFGGGWNEEEPPF
jgi:single-strand DNA-binding protein